VAELALQPAHPPPRPGCGAAFVGSLPAAGAGDGGSGGSCEAATGGADADGGGDALDGRGGALAPEAASRSSSAKSVAADSLGLLRLHKLTLSVPSDSEVNNR
jgi:hypothetical protein